MFRFCSSWGLWPIFAPTATLSHTLAYLLSLFLRIFCAVGRLNLRFFSVSRSLFLSLSLSRTWVVVVVVVDVVVEFVV